MLLRELLGLEYTRVVDVTFVHDGLLVDVAPTWRRPRCSGCGHNCPGYDRQRDRRWRHLDLAGMKFHLRYGTRRVDCPRCGVTVEHLPSAAADVGSWFTRPFEDHAGYLAQRCDKMRSSRQRAALDGLVDRRRGHAEQLGGLRRREQGVAEAGGGELLAHDAADQLLEGGEDARRAQRGDEFVLEVDHATTLRRAARALKHGKPRT